MVGSGVGNCRGSLSGKKGVFVYVMGLLYSWVIK